jgi:sporulation integral membrane protein YtvI
MNEIILPVVKKALKPVLVILLVSVVLFVLSKLALYVLPFVIALILSSVIEPVVKTIEKRLNLSRKTAVVLALILISVVVGLLLTLLISRLISELINISYFLPKYFSDTYSNLDSLIKKLLQMYIGLPDGITKNIEIVLQNCSQSVMELFSSLIKTIINTAISIPEAFIFIIVTILSTYFLSCDKDRIHLYFKKTLPERLVARVGNIKKDMLNAMNGYIKAQLILMSFTFSELFIGFIIIRVHQPLTLALFISIVDALPILGAGSVLIPWLLYELLIGNTRLGVSLLFLYLIVLVVRQLIEPKILSKQIGIHPLLTLMAMYIGLKLFGFMGLVVGPITVLLLKNVLSGAFENKSLKEVFEKKIYKF